MIDPTVPLGVPEDVGVGTVELGRTNASLEERVERLIK